VNIANEYGHGGTLIRPNLLKQHELSVAIDSNNTEGIHGKQKEHQNMAQKTVHIH